RRGSGVRSSDTLVCLVGDGDDTAGIELSHRPYQPMLPVFRASLRLENLLAVGRQILHDALIAIVAQRHRIDLDGAIALIEQLLFTGSIPDSANAAADEH